MKYDNDDCSTCSQCKLLGADLQLLQVRPLSVNQE